VVQFTPRARSSLPDSTIVSDYAWEADLEVMLKFLVVNFLCCETVQTGIGIGMELLTMFVKKESLS
jgi:hypothetical protein